MKVLIVSQHFPPENSGNASRVSDMAQKLAELGAEVTVLAPHPTFPTGTFKRKWAWRRETKWKDIALVNLWAWQPQAKDPKFASRIAYYLTFPFHATLWALLRPARYDVVIGSTPPVFTGIPGWIVTAIYRRKRFVVEVRDLWIDAAVSLGFVTERSLMTRMSRWLEGRFYKRSDLIAVTTEDVVRKIGDRYGTSPTKITVVPNGVDTTHFRPMPAQKKRQFLYAGNIGYAQDLGLVIDAIGIVRKKYPDATLVLAGAGDTRETLEAYVRLHGLEAAVQFAGILPREAVPALYAESIAGLAPLKKLPTLEYAVPTKAYEALGCGVPFLGMGIGEIRSLAAKSGGGLIAENRLDDLVEKMTWMIEHPDECAQMAKVGLAYVSAHYERSAIAARYLAHLEGVDASA